MRTSYDNSRDIARYVILAQKSSDLAKGENTISLRDKGSRKAKNYQDKLFWIVKALKVISTCKSGWDYFVHPDQPDQNGHPSVIVYFQYTDNNGKRYQISFHTPTEKSTQLNPYKGKGRKTHWDRRVCGSRDDSKKLIELFGFETKDEEISTCSSRNPRRNPRRNYSSSNRDSDRRN